MIESKGMTPNRDLQAKLTIFVGNRSVGGFAGFTNNIHPRQRLVALTIGHCTRNQLSVFLGKQVVCPKSLGKKQADNYSDDR